MYCDVKIASLHCHLSSVLHIFLHLFFVHSFFLLFFLCVLFIGIAMWQLQTCCVLFCRLSKNTLEKWTQTRVQENGGSE